MNNKTATIIVVLLMFGASPVIADEGEPPVITGARLFLNGGVVMGDLTCRNLFSDRVVGTVQSGLPAVVELLYQLVSSDHDAVSRGIHAYSLRYDVWDDVYSIDQADTTIEYPTFESMANAVENLRRIAIIPVTVVDPALEYAVRFSVSVHPLRGSEEQIVGWVGENVGGEGSSRSQLLNVNDLIQGFFARGRDVSNRSVWYETELFRAGGLPTRHGEDE